MAVIQIPNHAHCMICTKAIPFGDKTCSTKCEADFADLSKRRKRTMLFLYGLMGLTVVVFVLGTFNGGLGI